MSASTVLTVQEQSMRQQPGPTAVTVAGYNLSIGYLRAVITLLVVAHHAALAYIQFAPQPPTSLAGPNRIWQAFPVVDSQRSTALGCLPLPLQWHGSDDRDVGSRGWEIAVDSMFALSCATSSFALIALSVRFAKQHNCILDSLSANAYGIYLVH